MPPPPAPLISCAAAAVVLLAGSPLAHAQCAFWLPSGEVPGLSAPVKSLTRFDVDGPGPLGEQLIVAGDFINPGGTTARYLARFDGERWHAFEPSPASPVWHVTTWDPDGPGPQPEELIAVIFHSPSNTGLVHRWTGTGWQPITGSLTNLSKVTSFDFDGDGPEPPRLVGIGPFTTQGLNRIAFWDGSAWRPLGSGFNASVNAVRPFDPDADGPLPPRLIAAGAFTASGETPALRIAEWTGAGWAQLGEGLNNTVLALDGFDPDAEGPLPACLLVAGAFSFSGAQGLSPACLWDGEQWTTLGTGYGLGLVRAVTVWDANGDLPGGTQIFAGTGNFQYYGPGPWRWDGETWEAVGPPIAEGIDAMLSFDPDGDGAAPQQMYAAGGFTMLGGIHVANIARFDGSAWETLESGFSAPIRALHTFDFDGDGPEPARIIAGGAFTLAGGGVAPGLARSTDTGWEPIGTEAAGDFTAIGEFDFDGDGPQPPSLLATGLFRGTSENVRRVARWTGSAWEFVGGITAPLTTITSFDPDGDGPAPAQLYAAASTYPSVRRLVGNAWEAMPGAPNNLAYAMLVFDPDGDGPHPAELIFGGTFVSAGGVPVNNIARWNGSSWAGLGAGLNATVWALATFDPDGDGPEPAQLIAAGDFSSAGGAPAARIASWDGSTWRPLGPGLSGRVRALLAVDPDGPGPLRTQLLATGAFGPSGVTGRGIARWDGAHWRPVPGDIGSIEGFPTSEASPLTAVDPDGPGPEPVQVAVGGSFTHAGGRRSPYFARLTALGGPTILAHPAPLARARGQTATFTVDASGSGQLTHRWFVGGRELADGPTPHGSTIAGATTPTLSIINLTAADMGDYLAVVADDCGSIGAAPAALSVRCPADWDGDAAANSGDISAFLTSWISSVQAPDLVADFNADGMTNSGDISDFLTAWIDAVTNGC